MLPCHHRITSYNVCYTKLLRIQTFWALSKELADARHYPAIDWVDSFSADVGTAAEWWHENIDRNWQKRRGQALGMLARDAELSRIVNLVGPEASYNFV